MRKEAYLNEFKGFLFEFMVAQFLAQHYRCEASFLRSLSVSEKSSLHQYQKYLADLDSELMKQLPTLAALTAQRISRELAFDPTSISMVGKQQLSGHHSEADLLLQDGTQSLGMGLKLGKANSYINTKSGGLRSFLYQYFPCESAREWQAKTDALVSASFQEMGENLYKCAGLNWEGSFGPEWKESGQSSLPGEISEELHRHVEYAYARLAKHLYQGVQEIQDQYPDIFIQGLRPICGLGHDGLWQAICFHEKQDGQRYRLKRVEILNPAMMKASLAEIKLVAYQGSLSSFTLKTKCWNLQIRVKPMNVFTQSSFKVNCSLRFH